MFNWNGKKVFITGHTGFKGAWLSQWLISKGATVKGYSLPPEPEPNLYSMLQLSENLDSEFGDIRDTNKINASIKSFDPEVIIHMAAQALVRKSYSDPITTFDTNILGTAIILEASKNLSNLRCLINVTTDKCYENKEDGRPFKETDPLGGNDPYSASKACAEIVTHSYMQSFLKNKDVGIATVRAGNVIGGGDWSDDRLLPDIFRTIQSGKTLEIRNPEAVRPWQHVLDPLNGYISLAENLYFEPKKFTGPWNFGAPPEGTLSVKDIVRKIDLMWPTSFNTLMGALQNQPHEAQLLFLDCSKAASLLNWKQKLKIDEALTWTCEWYQAYFEGQNLLDLTLRQLTKFQEK